MNTSISNLSKNTVNISSSPVIHTINNKINKIVNILAWWIPVKKWRDDFRNRLLK